MFGDTTGLQPDQIRLMAVLNVATGALSVLSLLFLFGIFHWLEFRKKVTTRLVLYLSIANFAAGVGHLMFDLPVGTACIAQGFLLSLGEPLSFYWVFVIALAQFMTVVMGKGEQFLARFEIVVLAVVWPVGLALALVPLFLDVLAPAGAWCWISAPDANPTPAVAHMVEVLRWCLFYGPLWFVLFVNMLFYIFIVRRITRSVQQFGGGFAEARHRFSTLRLFFVPIGLFVTWSLPTVNRIQNGIAPHNPSVVLYTLHAFFAGTMGFWTFVAFVLDPVVAQRLRAGLCGGARTGPPTDSAGGTELSSPLTRPLIAGRAHEPPAIGQLPTFAELGLPELAEADTDEAASIATTTGAGPVWPDASRSGRPSPMSRLGSGSSVRSAATAKTAHTV